MGSRAYDPLNTSQESSPLPLVWLDAASNGQDTGRDGIEPPWGWTTQVVKPPPRRVLVADVEPTPRPAFTVLPRRWVVESSHL
jgi:hypothetical protein